MKWFILILEVVWLVEENVYESISAISCVKLRCPTIYCAIRYQRHNEKQKIATHRERQTERVIKWDHKKIKLLTGLGQRGRV